MQKPGIVYAAISLILIAAALFLVPHKHTRMQQGCLKVTATTTLIADAVREIAGEHVNLETLMGPGVDPHSYHARLSDLSKLQDADIVFYHGLSLEGKMITMLDQMHTYRPTYAVTHTLDQTDLIASDEFGGIYDPHVWFDISLWQKVITSIAHILIKHDVCHATVYEKRLTRYLEQLKSLETKIKTALAKVDTEQRYLITSHDAFSYFGRAYDMHVLGIQGINLDSEPGIRDMQNIVSFVCKHHIPTLFLETSLPHRSIQAIAHAAASRGWYVQIGNELYSDALGPKDSSTGSYIGMITHNTQTIIDGLTINQ